MAVTYYRQGYRGGSKRIIALSDRSERDTVGSNRLRSPFGMVTMRPPREEPNFSGPSHQPHSEDGEVPTELFKHVSPEITGAYVDPSLKMALPTMVALGMQSHNAEKDLPMADYALTRFSSALSRNAVSRGLAKPHPLNPDMSATAGDDGEEYDFEHAPMRWSGMRISEMKSNPATREFSPEEVGAARNWVREKVRGPQKQKQIKRGDSQFEQLNLGI